MAEFLSIFAGIFETLFSYIYIFFRETWWFFLFIILLIIARSTWLYWRQMRYKDFQKYALLELQIPRQTEKGITGIEHVFESLWGLGNWASDIGEKYLIGEVTRWISLEMVSFGGEIHFYIRAPHRQKELVKANIVSYYPDVEIIDVEDYIDALPKDRLDLRSKGLDLWGSEMILSRPEEYPIRMHDEFEPKARERYKKFDCISTFLEVLGKIKQDEFVGIQINIAPNRKGMGKYGKELIEKLRTPRFTKVKAGGKKEEEKTEKLKETPGEYDILKAVEENLSNLVFDTTLRFIYVSPQRIFYDNFARRGISGAFAQYSKLNLNSFQQNVKMSTMVRPWVFPFIFPKTRNKLRKERLLYLYRKREMPEHTFMGKLLTSHLFNWNFHSKTIKLTNKAIATLFHPPTEFVLTTPHMKRVESHKAAPERGLEIFGDKDALKKFGYD